MFMETGSVRWARKSSREDVDGSLILMPNLMNRTGQVVGEPHVSVAPNLNIQRLARGKRPVGQDANKGMASGEAAVLIEN